jgi:hypothetical protein
VTLVDHSGAPLAPSCVLPPFVPQIGPFRFFVQPGDADKLLVFHTGGGACWNGLTCASGLGLLPGVAGTYSPKVLDTAASLDAQGGVLDSDPSRNPFASWTKVYIPYCSGDVGWGNRQTTYPLPQPDGSIVPLTIQHRGYANIRTVVEWLQRRFDAQGTSPSRVVVAGSSAGGYASIGTLLDETLAVVGRRADVSVIGDSANGVVNDDFLQRARAAWGFDATLPAPVLNAVNQGAAGLPVRVYTNQAQAHRNVRFGQYQNAFDLAQTRVFNVMLHPDEPALWSDPQAIGQTLLQWSVTARASVLATALNPNYRFYTAAGYEHIVLQEIGPLDGFGFCSDHFATEASGLSFGQPVPLREWAKDMATRSGLTPRTDDWKNASCFPNCNVPPQCPLP